MKHIYKSIFLTSFCLLATTAYAQQDTTVNRQVMLEREYTPTLQDASRINTAPAIYEHTIKRSPATFVKQASLPMGVNGRLGSVPSGNIKTDIDYDKKRGYLNLAAGPNNNGDIALGYKLVDGERDQLDVYGTYTSAGGKPKFADEGYMLEKVKAKYADIKAKLRYQHAFDPSILTVYGGYGNTAFNYYGNSFIKPGVSTLSFDNDSKQQVSVISFGAGLESSVNNHGTLKYKGNISYDNFKNKYGLTTADDGMKGGILKLSGDFHIDFDSDKIVGLRGDILNQSISDITNVPKDNTHSLTNVGFNPYIQFEGTSWFSELGVNLGYVADVDGSFFFTPNVKAHYNIYEVHTIYASITGGINNNTVLDILNENRYATPYQRIKYSKTLYDAQIGFRSGIVPNLEFDLFAGYKHTKDDHLFGASNMFTLGQPTSWSNYSVPIYANVSTGHLGGALKTQLIPYTKLSAKLTTYFYSVDKLKYPEGNTFYSSQKKAWGRPTFTADLNADVNVIEPLTLSINYVLMTGRKAYSMDVRKNMNNINELNVGAQYKFTDWLSMNARVYNLFNQKHELVHGYSLQGLNFVGGFDFKF